MGGSDCEMLGDGWLAQPVNAWSSLAFGVAAVFVLVWSARSTAVERRWLAAGAVALALVAIGSFAYHGPQPSWGGPVHDGSIAVLLVVVAATLTMHSSHRGWSAWMAAGVLGLGGLAWLVGRTDGVLCRPDSVFQWHAAWHVLAAMAAAIAVVGPTRPPASR